MSVRSLTLACRVALVVMITRALSPSDYGAYALVGTVGAFATVLAGLNLSTYVLRAVPGLPPKSHIPIFKTTYLFETLLTLALVVTVIASGGLPTILEYFHADAYPGAFVLGLALTVLLVSNAEITSYFLGQTRIERANWVDFLAQAAWVLPLIVIQLAGADISLRMLLIAQICGSLAVIVYSGRHIGVSAWWQARPSLSILRSGLQFSVPLIIPAMAVNSARFADRLMLSYYGSLADVGLYAFAAVWVNTLYSFTAGVIFATFGPRIVAAHNQEDLEHRDFLQTYMLKISLLGFVIPLLILCAVAGPMIGLLARPEYAHAIAVMPIIGLSSVVMIIGYPASYLLTLRNRVVLLAGIDVVGTAVGLTANLVLIPRYSYLGAAVAGLLGLATTAGLQYLFSGMVAHLKLDVLFSVREEISAMQRGLRRIRASLGGSPS